MIAKIKGSKTYQIIVSRAREKKSVVGLDQHRNQCTKADKSRIDEVLRIVRAHGLVDNLDRVNQIVSLLQRGRKTAKIVL